MAASRRASAVGISELQMERAKERAEARAEIKASRATAAGMRLVKKRKKGWEILRERLAQGQLMPALRQLEGKDLDGKKSRMSMSMNTFAQIAKLTGNKGVMSGVEEKRLALDAKLLQEKEKRQREEREVRRKLVKKQKKLERELEYLNFPTIMGWYFDGFFTPYFQLNTEYATIFNQMELDISKAKENMVKESFVEKAKRYFWPPDIIAGMCFRSRGIYLDFDDIMKDPPHTPPDIVLDQRVEAVTLFMATETTELDSKVPSDEDLGALGATELQAEEDKLQEMLKMIDNDNSISQEEKAMRKKALMYAFHRKKEKALLQQRLDDEMLFKATGKNDFYFDDQAPGFFKKRFRDRDQYYYDSHWGIWRAKRKIVQFPSDFYWDEQLALFFPKDRTRPADYYLFDANLGVYRVGGDTSPPNWRGVKPTNFYFDHNVGKWLKKSNAPAGVVPYFDQNGGRFVAKKEHDSPDDFYFDVKLQQYERKEPDPKLYFYDPSFGTWRKVGTGYPAKGSTRPFSFYWNEEEHCFKKKDAPSSFFVWDQNSNFFRKKKSLHGKFHPKNWTWNEKKKRWEMRKSLSKHLFMSESLYWRPDRDYDKPWLEYIGGYRDFHLEYDYQFDDDDNTKSGGPGPSTGTAPPTGGGPVGVTLKPQVSMSEPALAKKGILSTGTEKDITTPKDKTVKMEDDKDKDKDKGKATSEKTESEMETLMFVDTLDRKTLKITGLGNIITDVDLRKYFGSVKKVIRPKIPGSDLDEDYAYLKFKTDEAAAAALKTMHEQYIKGIKVFLSYKLKAEDETRGGQRDVGSERQSKKKIQLP